MDDFPYCCFHLLHQKQQGAQGCMEISVSLVHIKWESEGKNPVTLMQGKELASTFAAVNG